MTYEKHIEALQMLYASGPCKAAIDAAIELMRAAEPKDAAAERARILRGVPDAVAKAGDAAVGAYVLQVERERAQARAEVEAKYARLVEAVTHYRTERLGNSRNKSLGEMLAALDELEGK